MLKKSKQITQKIIDDSSFLLDDQDNNGNSNLIYAILTKNDDLVQKFISQKEENTKAKTTPLMAAAAVNNIQAVKELCQNQCKQQTSSGITALMIAASQGFSEIVKILQPLEEDIIDNQYRTAYDHALLNGHYETSILLEQQYKEQHLLEAFQSYDIAQSKNNQQIKHQSLQIIEHLIQKRQQKIQLSMEQSQQIKKKGGMTSLMYAAKHNLYQFIPQLFDQLKQQDENGMTASMYAAYNNSQRSLELLFDKEAKIQDNKGRTASMYATMKDNYECLSITYTEEYDIRDNDQNTLLHYAASNNSLRILNEIKDAYIQNVNQRGETAFMMAAKSNSVACLQILKDEQDLLDLNHRTALMFAAMNDSAECVEKLIDKQQNIINSDGLRAIDYTIKAPVSKSLPYLLVELKNSPNLLFKLIDNDRLETLKIICDVARQGTSQFSQCVYNYKQQQYCQIALQQKYQSKNKKQKNVDYEGADLLTYSILTNKSKFVTMLSFALPRSSYNGYTPLMLAVQKDNQLEQNAIDALIHVFQCKINQDGQNALIIGLQSQVDNEEILKQLAEVEYDQIDKFGKKPLDYAVQFEKTNIVKIIKDNQK